MSRIQKRFNKLQAENKKALVPFIAAGDPEPSATVNILHSLVSAGADLLELGIPFSDPMAEGLPIQEAYERALAHHVTLHDVLEMVTAFRGNDKETPIVLMGYLNPIEHMGYAKFADLASAAGVDGIIMVDLTAEESTDLQQQLKRVDIDLIFLLAPTSSDERVKYIASLASGYLYYVSLKGVTGSSQLDVGSVDAKIKQIKQHTALPITVGFGIKTPETAAQIASIADGSVVGSVLVDMAKQYPNNEKELIQQMSSLVLQMRQAMDNSR